MDSPGYVRPAGNGPKGETGTAVKYLKTESLKKARRFWYHLHRTRISTAWGWRFMKVNRKYDLLISVWSRYYDMYDLDCAPFSLCARISWLNHEYCTMKNKNLLAVLWWRGEFSFIFQERSKLPHVLYRFIRWRMSVSVQDTDPAAWQDHRLSAHIL